MINFNHESNSHSYLGAIEALQRIMPQIGHPNSVLDVGCGYGYWLKAISNLYACEVFGVDGVDISQEHLQIDKKYFLSTDLNKPFDLKRKFDLIMCLEVAEHLEPNLETQFVQTLVNHADAILFSAAVPKQKGDHHINCQWPFFWQSIFNKHGFECSDIPRQLMWDLDSVEPWYCQNMLYFFKSDNAGKEPRITSIVHPRMVDHIESIDTVYLNGKIYQNQLLLQEIQNLKNQTRLNRIKTILLKIYRKLKSFITIN